MLYLGVEKSKVIVEDFLNKKVEWVFFISVGTNLRVLWAVSSDKKKIDKGVATININC